MSIFSTIFSSWATSSSTENMLFSQGWWIISETWKVYCLTASPNLYNMYLCKRIALVNLRISLVSSQKVTILLDLDEPWQQHVWWVTALIYGKDLPKVLFGSWWRHANYKKFPKISVAYSSPYKLQILLCCVCVFMLFHLLVSFGCTTSVIYVRSSDQRSFDVSIFWVLLPSSFISISESILFHLQRRKLQLLLDRKRYDIMCSAKRWYILI